MLLRGQSVYVLKKWIERLGWNVRQNLMVLTHFLRSAFRTPMLTVRDADYTASDPLNCVEDQVSKGYFPETGTRRRTSSKKFSSTVTWPDPFCSVLPSGLRITAKRF